MGQLSGQGRRTRAACVGKFTHGKTNGIFLEKGWSVPPLGEDLGSVGIIACTRAATVSLWQTQVSREREFLSRVLTGMCMSRPHPPGWFAWIPDLSPRAWNWQRGAQQGEPGLFDQGSIKDRLHIHVKTFTVTLWGPTLWPSRCISVQLPLSPWTGLWFRLTSTRS